MSLIRPVFRQQMRLLNASRLSRSLLLEDRSLRVADYLPEEVRVLPAFVLRQLAEGKDGLLFTSTYRIALRGGSLGHLHLGNRVVRHQQKVDLKGILEIG